MKMNETIQQTTKLFEEGRKQYFKRIGNNLANPLNGSNTYYSLIDKLLSKIKAPAIPPLIRIGNFVLDFNAKTEVFNAYFIQQC